MRAQTYTSLRNKLRDSYDSDLHILATVTHFLQSIGTVSEHYYSQATKYIDGISKISDIPSLFAASLEVIKAITTNLFSIIPLTECLSTSEVTGVG